MDKRYQIFVSSTYLDLVEERQGVIQTILKLEQIPVGMEVFPASNETQFDYIKRVIDMCDYYILILGGRYGSMNEKEGKSYTELEYRYALEKGIPILVFPYDNPDQLPENKREKDHLQMFRSFRHELVNSKLCNIWSDKSELINAVAISLSGIFLREPRSGWIKGGFFDTNILNSLSLMEPTLIETYQINYKIDKEIEQSLEFSLKFILLKILPYLFIKRKRDSFRTCVKYAFEEYLPKSGKIQAEWSAVNDLVKKFTSLGLVETFNEDGGKRIIPSYQISLKGQYYYLKLSQNQQL